MRALTAAEPESSLPMQADFPTLAYLAVIGGALLHASWNVAIRSGTDRRMETARLVAGGSVVALTVLPFMRQPALAAWPHLAITAILHVAYFGLLAAAYARARVAVSYPLMRGVAPLLVLVACCSAAWHRAHTAPVAEDASWN